MTPWFTMLNCCDDTPNQAQRRHSRNWFGVTSILSTSLRSEGRRAMQRWHRISLRACSRLRPAKHVTSRAICRSWGGFTPRHAILPTKRCGKIRDAVDRILLIKEFGNQKPAEPPRLVAPTFVDQAMADILKEQFANDTAKFSAFLQSRGVTQEQYRKEVEDTIAVSYIRNQQRKLDKEKMAK